MSMPQILYGTAWKKSRTANLVTAAIKVGFRGIDTAGQPKHYDEVGVGAGIAAALNSGLTRQSLYIQTKFTPLAGQDPAHVPYDPAAPLAEQVAQSFASSLRNLQTSYVDCLILHSPLPNAHDMAEVWRAMEAVVQQGGARRLGISNCSRLTELESLYRIAKVKPSVVQNRFYAKTGYDRELRMCCRAHAISYQSFWTLTANRDMLAHSALRALSLKYGRTAPQILFRYLTQSGITPLTGTTNATHMQEDLAIFEFELTPVECGTVTKLLSRAMAGQ
ncbi:MAG: aldo/keto reductase [Gammaproteobacteria bacterium]|nr:aldo/keto reductase [Gammaproteobacteria bacterium]